MHHRTSRTNNSPLFYTTDLINYTPNTSPIKTRLPNRDFKTQGYRQTTNTDQQPPPVSQPYPDHQPATRNQHRMEPNTPTQTFRVRAENVINAGGILTNTHTPIIHLHRPTQPSPSRARPPPPPRNVLLTNLTSPRSKSRHEDQRQNQQARESKCCATYIIEVNNQHPIPPRIPTFKKFLPSLRSRILSITLKGVVWLNLRTGRKICP